MTKFYFQILILLSIFFSISETYADNTNALFSFTTNELYIPKVIIDNKDYYRVKMKFQNNVFLLSEIINIPSPKELLVKIEKGMTRHEVLNILGIPDKIKNYEKKSIAFCSEPTIDIGKIYEQWEYGVDSTMQGPSGMVVWFAEIDDSSKWLVIDTSDGFVCF